MKRQKEELGILRIDEIEVTRKESVVVNGFAEAAAREQSKAKTFTWFFSQKRREKISVFRELILDRYQVFIYVVCEGIWIYDCQYDY